MNFVQKAGLAVLAASGVFLGIGASQAQAGGYQVQINEKANRGPFNVTIKAPQGRFPVFVPGHGTKTAQAQKVTVFCQGFAPVQAQRVGHETWKAQCPKDTLWLSLKTEDGFPLIGSAQVSSNKKVVVNPGVNFKPFKGINQIKAGFYPASTLPLVKEEFLN